MAAFWKRSVRARISRFFATEIWPWNQGGLIIKILNDNEIPTTYIVGSAVRSVMIDLVVVGADAITVNGAVVNKIVTFQIALCANEACKNVIRHRRGV